MADAAPAHDTAAVVILGSFNPKIMQPMWFASQGLIRPEEAEKADITLIHPGVADFSADWLRIQVTNERFFASNTAAGHWQQLSDLVVGTFRVLEHTPVSAMGLNRGMHFNASDEESWHRIGDILAPKEFWKNLMGVRPGMRSLTIEGTRPGSKNHVLRVKVEPSVMIPNGIFVDTNEHYADGEPGSLRRLMELLAANWEASLAYALSTARSVLDLGRAQ